MYYKLLSIRQCLELLEKRNCHLITNIDNGINTYNILQYNIDNDQYQNIIYEYPGELIDALTKALLCT